MIHVQGRGEPVPSSPAVSILVSLQRHGVPIDTVCGGRAQCGRCLIRVLAGSERMNRPAAAELHRLEALGAGPGHRLACQSYTRGDLEIQVINPDASNH
jgi:adenylate cyclase